jgi:anti-sigma B factor antagonist
MKPARSLTQRRPLQNRSSKDEMMPSAKSSMSVRTPAEHVSIIDIQGEVNLAAEKALMDAYTQANATQARFIVLNFRNLDYMNSSGIGLLVTLLIRAQRQQQHLLAFGLTEHYVQIFELTRLNEAILLYATEQEALASLNTTQV